MTPPNAPKAVTRTKLWSQEVKEANPLPEEIIAYQFSGKTFYEGGRQPVRFLSEPINE